MFRLICVVILLSGCSILPDIDDVLPDKRVEYKKSESMPDLEVPPDLTAGAINDSMAIPNEDQQASLSEYRRGQQAAPAAVAPSQSPAPTGQQWVAVRASRFDIWPKLRTYFEAKGFQLELDDAELGVLETSWSAPMDLGGLHRYKFKVFSEPGAEQDVTVLFVSALTQQQQAGGEGEASWLDKDPDEALGKQIAGELNLQLNGPGGVVAQAPAAGGTAEAGSNRPRAEMMNDEEGRVYLSIPEEFTGAWRHTETALQQGGFIIDEQDSAKGFYKITYFDPAAAPAEKGWLSKLAFWKDDEAAAKGTTYGVSLTGMGEKTELIVLNDKGDWESNQDAGRILSIIQNQYNTQ